MAMSELKHKIDLLNLEEKYELEKLKMKYETERKQLLAKCNHRYDNNSSAEIMKGLQWDNWYECAICGKHISRR